MKRIRMGSLRLLFWFVFVTVLASGLKPMAAHSPENFCVCIDPGHPSENNDGEKLTNGLRETTLNWDVALLLKQRLEDDGFKVVMTKKTEKEFVTNKRRAEIANAAEANLFLRLHADEGNSSGFTVYYPSRRGSSQGVEGPSAEVLAASKPAASIFHRAFATSLKGELKDNGLRGEEGTFIGGKQGALTGSIFSKVPTLLVEMIFITSRQDAEWIKQDSNKRVMVQALATGIHAVLEADHP
jgi:N-acetylmuramoyl-L-alanine amidase